MTNQEPKVPLPTKVIRKHVKIKNSNMVQKELKSKYSLLQRKVCEWLNIVPADTYQYMYRVEYFGTTTLKFNDVVVNSEGVIMVVLKESNRIAMMVTQGAFIDKPKVYGKLTIIEKPKTTKQ